MFPREFEIVTQFVGFFPNQVSKYHLIRKHLTILDLLKITHTRIGLLHIFHKISSRGRYLLFESTISVVSSFIMAPSPVPLQHLLGFTLFYSTLSVILFIIFRSQSNSLMFSLQTHTSLISHSEGIGRVVSYN